MHLNGIILQIFVIYSEDLDINFGKDKNSVNNIPFIKECLINKKIHFPDFIRVHNLFQGRWRSKTSPWNGPSAVSTTPF